MSDRNPPVSAYPLVRTGFATADVEREGASRASVLIGMVFAALAIGVIGFGVLERDARGGSRVYLGRGPGPPAYSTATPSFVTYAPSY